jgi:hypothetical protein
MKIIEKVDKIFTWHAIIGFWCGCIITAFLLLTHLSLTLHDTIIKICIG